MAIQELSIDVSGTSVVCSVGDTLYTFTMGWAGAYTGDQSINFLRYKTDDGGNVTQKASMSIRSGVFSLSVEQINNVTINEYGKLVLYLKKNDDNKYDLTGTASYGSDSLSSVQTASISDELTTTEVNSLSVTADIPSLTSATSSIISLS